MQNVNITKKYGTIYCPIFAERRYVNSERDKMLNILYNIITLDVQKCFNRFLVKLTIEITDKMAER